MYAVRTILVVLVVLCTCMYGEMVSLDLRSRMGASEPTQLHSVFVVMNQQVESNHLRAMSQGMEKEQCRACITEYLKTFSQESQEDLLNYLFSMQHIGKVKSIRSLWLINIVFFEATVDVIEMVVQRFDIRLVDLQRDVRIIPAMERVIRPPYALRGLGWQLAKVRAPDVWVEGHTGLDVIIGIIDSGVRYTHYDLADHLWTNAGEIPDDTIDNDNNGYVDDYYGYDFFYDQPDPMDCLGHGTAVAGMAAGDGTAGCSTGVAPDARIMSLKIADSTGYASNLSAWLEAFQYALDMGADVVNISYGIPGQLLSWRGLARESFEILLAADMLVTACAGNSGNQQGTYPIPYNIWTPADSPPPWLHPDQTLNGGLSACMTIGATDSFDVIGDFSSRGPVTWQDNSPWFDYAYNPGVGLIDPDLTAPGKDVNLLWNYNDSCYLVGWGTSFASPMTAGAAALLLSIDPELEPAFVDSILEMTSVELGDPHKDNVYGAGRLDCYAACVGITEHEFHDILYSSIGCVPNPFSNIIHIQFSMRPSPHAIKVYLQIYDASGRIVRSFNQESNIESQVSAISWHGDDNDGRELPSGVYFVKLRAGDYSATEKLLLIR